MAVYTNFIAVLQPQTAELLGAEHSNACGESQLNGAEHSSWLLLALQSRCLEHQSLACEVSNKNGLQKSRAGQP
jgi:hypothetical protein